MEEDAKVSWIYMNLTGLLLGVERVKENASRAKLESLSQIRVESSRVVFIEEGLGQLVENSNQLPHP